MAISAGEGAESTIELPKKLDQASCGLLVERLSEGRGAPIRINAASVEFLGGQASEILLRARMEWEVEDLDFRLIDASSALLEGLDLLGIPRDLFVGEVEP